LRQRLRRTQLSQPSQPGAANFLWRAQLKNR
jgi:hypothetical protein